MFESFDLIALGLLTGFVFGFLLQKGGVTKYEVIVRQFLLQDFTVLKTMLTAIVVGGFGVYFLEGQGLAKLSIKPALLVANIGGGLIFGVGMVLLGLCPGTAVAALGERNRRAFAGTLGMLVGAFLQAESYNTVASCAKWVDLGAMTLPQLFHASPMVILSGLAIVAVSLFVVLERMERKAR
ncbi:MAG: YeeE/YedE family protein [Planctomycetaceae bacterium]|nr:YeeE/YedE family protein [Planctomycetaceae bacterium]